VSPTAYAHFIGVGGAGMSGLARVLHDRGFTVTGSDLKASRYSSALEDAGILVHLGHAAENLGDPGVVVVSSAIPQTNPELAEAVRRGIEVWPRAKMLAHLAGDDRTLAVAGTHGKTTTSSMLATVIDGLGLDPTFLVGGELNEMGGNARCGKPGFYVVEADESDGSLLHLRPHIAIITNIEADHLDHYGSFDEILDVFARFIASTDPDGAVVVCADDARLVSLAREHARCRVLTYGFAQDADVRCVEPVSERDGQGFFFVTPDGSRDGAHIAVPGRHNVANATAVMATVVALGLDTARAAASLARFGGVRRRFERVGEVGGVTVVDDYAHHPTEVKATLAASRDVAEGRVWVVFQPHRYSRTLALGEDFGRAFQDADHVVLMDVYSAGEAPIPGVSGKTVLDALLASAPRTQVAYFPHRGDVESYVAARVRPHDLVLTMGAGDVTAIGGEIARALHARQETGS